jgi:hypothetical protein
MKYEIENFFKEKKTLGEKKSENFHQIKEEKDFITLKTYIGKKIIFVNFI